MTDPRPRHARLLQLLPRLYTAQPRSSAVGAIVGSMAATLSRLDDALTRIQHDRWVALASPRQAGDAQPSALEALGQLLQVSRLPPRIRHAGYEQSGSAQLAVSFDALTPLAEALDELIGQGWRRSRNGHPPADPAVLLAEQFPELRFSLPAEGQRLIAELAPEAPPEALARFQTVLDPEPGETFRQRLLVTARVRTRGLTTPRALLSLAIADLGAEPCPDLQRRADSTLAWGMPPGTRKRCPACASEGRLPCPRREQAVVEAWLTENPCLPGRHSESALRLRRPFDVHNPSLHADRPVVRLTVREQPAAYPALRSLDSGEITLYAGTLKPDETLLLYPTISEGEAQPFDGFDAPGHHAWRTSHPNGQALLIGADGSQQDVSTSIFYLWGKRFDDPASTLGEMRCGVLDQRVVTPRLAPAANRWMLLTFAQPDAEYADRDTQVHASRFAGADDVEGTSFALLDGSISHSDSRYASVLFESFSKTDTGSASEESTANAPRLSLSLEWVTRPPASFRLRVPKSAWVAVAASRGALALLRSDVVHATAAGVRALVDFPEPPQREAVAPADAAVALTTTQRWRDETDHREGPLQIALANRQQAPHEVGEGRFSMRVVFDTTRLDWSHAG